MTVTVLTPPRPPLVDRALADAKTWCHGQIIDDRPALTHAARVAVMIGKHVADPPPELIAAALLHDSPDFAPPEIDLDAVLARRYGGEVVRIVRALEAEHTALDTGNLVLDIDDQAVLIASTADKIVALTSLARRAVRSGDPAGFFAIRPALLGLLPHFRAFAEAATSRVPASMTHQLHQALGTLIATARGAS